MDEPDSDPEAAAREKAIRHLARREHSRRELYRKLLARFDDPVLINGVLDALASEGLLSEERFTEVFIRQRVAAGYGPLRIRAELSERGVDGGIVDAHLQLYDDEWTERCHEAWHKRFGEAPQNRREWARQMRFLTNRGFPSGLAQSIIGDSQ
ncbi:regulatory protein RecX [Spiribacter sp. 218]|jgi:regulatory protein|uniref:regulatory protein RecX n=1 Tax=Spiribacter pallidus TaxID=1987936 RepID=UPI00349F1344